MNIGLLNTRIMVQKNSLSEDEIGNQILSFEDYFSCAATIGGESGSERALAGQTVATEMLSFTVRFCPEIAVINTTNYRVIWNDEIYNITSIDHMNLKRKSVKLWCEKARR